MKEWLEYGYYETVKRVEKDTLYQALLERCAEQECLYLNIIQKLTPEERLVVEDYIALCEELQYQKTHTAYYCGKEAGLMEKHRF